MSPSQSLAALTGERPAGTRAGHTAVPPPPRRWATRVLLPLAILMLAAALIAWSARDALWPRTAVHTVPVIAKPRPATDAATESDDHAAHPAAPETVIVQAPGWFEPDPFAIGVPALTEGVVKDVLVLEGQHVDAGQIVVRLIDDDARLSLALAEAQLAEREATLAQARADLAAAQARAAEVRDEVERKSGLTDDGAFSTAQHARLKLRLSGLEAETQAALAAVSVAAAARATQEVIVRQATLALARTELRAPVAGVVLSRHVEPGSRVAMPAGPGTPASTAEVLRLYDPARLQVRVDVPLADAAKVGIGTRARITSETLPDTEFQGTVTRILHEANIERNTVQFKVAIAAPRAELKPEMLARVRFVTGDAAAPGAREPAANDSRLLLLIDERALIDRAGSSAAVWVVLRGPRGDAVASRRAVTLGPSAPNGFVEATGLSPTDRVIVDPSPRLTERTRIRVLEQAPEAAHE